MVKFTMSRDGAHLLEALMREEGLGIRNRRPDVLDWCRHSDSRPQP